MTASQTVATPLGPLLVSIACGPEQLALPDRRSLPLALEALTRAWSDVGGLEVRSVTRRTALPTYRDDVFPVTDCWGVALDLHATETTGPVTIAATLSEAAVRGDLTADEDLVAIEFVTDEWVLAIAGIDEVGLSREAHEGHQPTSWKDLDMPAEDGAGHYGLRWHLPGLVPGEHAHMFIEVAWCRTGHPNSLDAPLTALGRAESQHRPPGTRT